MALRVLREQSAGADDRPRIPNPRQGEAGNTGVRPQGLPARARKKPASNSAAEETDAAPLQPLDPRLPGRMSRVVLDPGRALSESWSLPPRSTLPPARGRAAGVEREGFATRTTPGFVPVVGFRQVQARRDTRQPNVKHAAVPRAVRADPKSAWTPPPSGGTGTSGKCEDQNTVLARTVNRKKGADTGGRRAANRSRLPATDKGSGNFFRGRPRGPACVIPCSYVCASLRSKRLDGKGLRQAEPARGRAQGGAEKNLRLCRVDAFENPLCSRGASGPGFGSHNGGGRASTGRSYWLPAGTPSVLQKCRLFTNTAEVLEAVAGFSY